MSANLVVDLGGTAQMAPSVWSSSLSGQVCGLSGVQVGIVVDLLNANTYCNVVVNGVAALTSGPLLVGVQTSDSTASGTFTDPTSGLAQLPTWFASGGFLIINSGSTGNAWGGTVVSGGMNVLSGFTTAAAFQRPHRYARLFFASGFYLGYCTASFISQLKTTGSGGGFSFSPGSGSVSV